MQPVAWFVAFLPRASIEAPAWWARGLHPGYVHTLACRAEGELRTLVLDHRGSRLVAAVEPMPIGHFLRALQHTAGAWILATVAEPGADRGQLRGPATCVEAVKLALGIRAPFIITPRQLARHLRRRGARPVLPIAGKD